MILKDLPATDADVAQAFRSSSAMSLGFIKNASRPQNRVTVFLPCRFSITMLILGSFPFLKVKRGEYGTFLVCDSLSVVIV